ncbi:hypothetical protein [Archangium sp.]|uniref:hypothetical protein n=1 Tax=Archangium sp. TaxID=1872627 RepID=UPI00286B25CB|nr:hypothetical protein [Archangium sp.]
MSGRWSRATLITLLAVIGVGGCGRVQEDPEVDQQAAPLTVEVEPDCRSVEVSSRLEWPPNHKFRLITLSSDEELFLSIDSVTQDEPVNDTGDGNTPRDARWVDDRTDAVYLRAERSGQGDGRVYRIRFTARDEDEKKCTGTVLVGVPHDNGKGSTPLESAGTYDSFGDE